MKGFIYRNQSIVIIVSVVIVLIIAYFFIKKLPTKVVKKEKESKKEADKESKDKIEEIKKEEDIQQKTQTEEINQKKEDKKPKIVQIYKREQKKTDAGEENKTKIDPIYDRNVEFINTSKNIAKFKSFSEENKEEIEQGVNSDEYGFVSDVQEDCDFCENKVKHFDHTRRLSKAIKDDNFENMFESHISEKYMKINSDRHLNLNEKFQKNLFGRTETMLMNSGNKVKNDEHDKSKFSLFSSDVNEDDFIGDEDVEINMKMALLADTYFKKRIRKLK